MEITFESDIGSFIKTKELNKDKGSSVLRIYNNQFIIIYLKIQQIIVEQIFEKDMQKQLTKEEVQKIIMTFKRGFDRNIYVKDRGMTNIAYYNNYINGINYYFENNI
jgi:hypothetical protein